MRMIFLFTGFALGMYLIIADWLKIPYLKSSRGIWAETTKD